MTTQRKAREPFILSASLEHLEEREQRGQEAQRQPNDGVREDALHPPREVFALDLSSLDRSEPIPESDERLADRHRRTRADAVLDAHGVALERYERDLLLGA